MGALDWALEYVPVGVKNAVTRGAAIITVEISSEGGW
jgi:hypothetical protein